jgi:hypothetical protein
MFAAKVLHYIAKTLRIAVLVKRPPIAVHIAATIVNSQGNPENQ